MGSPSKLQSFAVAMLSVAVLCTAMAVDAKPGNKKNKKNKNNPGQPFSQLSSEHRRLAGLITGLKSDVADNTPAIGNLRALTH